ncbi:MAG: molybdopterin-binding protein [Chloroflexota bacterium]|nr:molybdopterin-binding protein [Chloroflexota bacterium]
MGGFETMRAQILSIGDEILGGYITDTNSTWLAQQLALLNFDLMLVTHVGDHRDRIAETISDALDECELVICTGGVGPTEDDLTREAIAQVVGETPVVDESLLSTIRDFFAGRGLDMPERNAKQAWTIPSCESLPNPVGTAPGWLVRASTGGIIVAMPGVPREMFLMWNEQVVPRLASLRADRVVRSVTLKTIGIGESMVEQEMHHLITRADPVIATYAKDDGVHIRITASGSSVEAATSARDACIQEVLDIVGPYVYGRDDETLPGTLIELLERLELTLAVSDCGGGGRFASLLAATPSAHSVLLGTSMHPVGIKGMSSGLAQSALDDYEADLGVGISVSTEPTAPGVYSANIEVAVLGQRQAYRSFPIRSGFEDIQRRSGLLAAEVLRSALISD